MRNVLKTYFTVNRKLFLQWCFVLGLFCVALYYFCIAFLFIKTDLPSSPSSSISLLRTKHPFSKYIVILIDALRYDFVVPPSNAQEKLLPHLSILSKLRHQYPQHSLLYKFIADAPTTTSQRLKALVTGDLPSFIEAGKNFNSDELMQSNWLESISQNGTFSIQILGDDTWLQLFPFSKESVWKFQNQSASHFFPSFDVWDLDTVDNGILQYWNQTLLSQKLNSNSSITIGHFLGIDHAGHRYGVFHEEMFRKVEQMNQIIQQTIEQMDEHTLLIIMGDHGMNDFGDHGGDDLLEVNSALFFFSKQFAIHNQSQDLFPQSIPQIDLVPTMALLTGVPIPRQNLGSIIMDLFDNVEVEECPLLRNHSLYSKWKTLRLLQTNVQQITLYLKELNHISLEQLLQTAALPLLELHQPSLQLFAYLLGEQKCFKVETVLNDPDLVKNLIDPTIDYYQQYLKTISTQVRSVWSKFNYVLMSMSVNFMTLACVLVFVIVYLKCSILDIHGIWWVNVIAGFLLLFIASLFLYLAEVFFPMLRILTQATVFNIISGIIFAKESSLKRVVKFDAILHWLLLAFYFFSFYSNSFVVYEDRIMYYLLVTCIVAVLLQIWSNPIFSTVKQWFTIALGLQLLCIKFSTQSIRFRTHGTHSIAEAFSMEYHWLWMSIGLSSILYLQFDFLHSQHQWLRNVLQKYCVLQSVVIGMYWYGYYCHQSILYHSVLQLWLPRICFVTAMIMMIVLAGKRLLQQTHWFLILFYPMLILKGYTYLLPCILFLIQFYLFGIIQIGNRLHLHFQLFIMWCMGNQYFFSLGQQNTFNTIQWLSAFIGLENANVVLSGVLVVCNTLAPRILMALEGGMLILKQNLSFGDCCKHLFVYWVWNALTVRFAADCVLMHSRHLMLWAIFAPKFIFDGISFVVISVICLSFLIVFMSKSVKKTY